LYSSSTPAVIYFIPQARFRSMSPCGQCQVSPSLCHRACLSCQAQVDRKEIKNAIYPPVPPVLYASEVFVAPHRSPTTTHHSTQSCPCHNPSLCSAPESGPICLVPFRHCLLSCSPPSLLAVFRPTTEDQGANLGRNKKNSRVEKSRKQNLPEPKVGQPARKRVRLQGTAPVQAD